MKSLLLWIVFLAACACFIPSVEAQYTSVMSRAVDGLYSLSIMARLVICLGLIGLISAIACLRGAR